MDVIHCAMQVPLVSRYVAQIFLLRHTILRHTPVALVSDSCLEVVSVRLPFLPLIHYWLLLHALLLLSKHRGVVCVHLI